MVGQMGMQLLVYMDNAGGEELGCWDAGMLDGCKPLAAAAAVVMLVMVVARGQFHLVFWGGWARKVQALVQSSASIYMFYMPYI